MSQVNQPGHVSTQNLKGRVGGIRIFAAALRTGMLGFFEMYAFVWQNANQRSYNSKCIS